MCGLVGIVGNRDVAAEIYDALTMLQHRGQDAAGIMTCQQGKFLQRKGEGRVLFCTEERKSIERGLLLRILQPICDHRFMNYTRYTCNTGVP